MVRDNARVQVGIGPLRKPKKFGAFPYTGPESLAVFTPQFGTGMRRDRSDLFDIAVEILRACGFGRYGPNNGRKIGLLESQQRQAAFFNAMVQGLPMTRRDFADEYVVFQDLADRWWMAAVEPGNWEYVGSGPIYHFVVEDMLSVLPPAFFDQMGFAVKWAATVVGFEVSLIRLRQVQAELSADADQDMRFGYTNQAFALGFRLGADLAAVVKAAERKLMSEAGARKKNPYQDELEKVVLETIKAKNIGGSGSAPSGFALEWIYEMEKETKFGQLLESLNCPKSEKRLEDLIIRVAKREGIFI
jgi:hypothetical protein